MTRHVISVPLARIAAAALLLVCAGGGARAADPQDSGLAPFLRPARESAAVAPEPVTGAEPAEAFTWRFGGADAGGDALRARARNYAAERESVPEPGALATAAVALGATALGLAAGRRRTRRPVGGTEWDGGDESVLAS